MKIKNNIYNVRAMLLKKEHTAAAAVLALAALTACTNDEAVTQNNGSDPATTPITVSATVPQAFGSLSGTETRGFNGTSGLSSLGLLYPDMDGNYQRFDINDNNITQAVDNDNAFSFNTKPISPNIGLYWQEVKGQGNEETRFHLRVTKTFFDYGFLCDLWGTKLYTPSTVAGEEVNRETPLDFTLHYREALLTVIVKSERDLLPVNLQVSLMSTEDTSEQIDRLPICNSITNSYNQRNVIYKRAGEQTQSITGNIFLPCHKPGIIDGVDDKTLKIWYDSNSDQVEDTGETYTLDLTTVSVTRDATGPFNPNSVGAWPYNTTDPNATFTDAEYAAMTNGKALYGLQRFNATATDFAFNPGEHITLTLTLNLDATLGSIMVNVKALAVEDEGNIDVPKDPTD